MSFKKNKYSVLKNAIPKEIAHFCFGYLLNSLTLYKTPFGIA